MYKLRPKVTDRLPFAFGVARESFAQGPAATRSNFGAAFYGSLPSL